MKCCNNVSGGQIDCWPPAGGAQVHFSPKFQSHLAEIKLQQFTMQFRKLILSQAVFKKTKKENADVIYAHFSELPQMCPPLAQVLVFAVVVKTVLGNTLNSSVQPFDMNFIWE